MVPITVTCSNQHAKYSYEAHIKYLDLQSLKLCRLIVDLIWCYKIVVGLVDVDVNEFFVLSSASHTRENVLIYAALFVKE